MATIRSVGVLNNGFLSAKEMGREALSFEKLSAAVENTDRLEYALGILELLLAVRFLFDLFNASALNLLDKLVEVVTFPFIAPFWLLFGKEPSYALSKGELQTLAAMIIYPVIVWGIMYAVKNNRKNVATTKRLQTA